MFLAEVRIENFRAFGEGNRAFVLPLQPGLTALVGENDVGKTAVIDALRLVLGVQGQDYLRVGDGDFNQPAGADNPCAEIRVRLRFDGLLRPDRKAFLEYLTYDDNGDASLYLTSRATTVVRGGRQYRNIETRSGADGKGPVLDADARPLLYATYLRPLRDAEQELSAGRGSRLSQILQHTREVTSHGAEFDPDAATSPDPRSLSVLGIGDFANYLLQNHEGIGTARDRLNKEYLAALSFAGDLLRGAISVSGTGSNRAARLRQLLEKLELDLRDEGATEPPPSRGLGSNNLLFIAAELLLSYEDERLPLLLIEEPEAHLHPQRQLRLMQFLQGRTRTKRADGQRLQVVITTHSPNLASVIDVNKMVLLQNGQSFPLDADHTCLSRSDYAFLQRFLDVTKANLFFARGVLIVEGDAEAILLPTLASLIGRDLTAHGVSIVNVGHTGLGRFARIFQRRFPERGQITTRVACVADLDIMPDCAPIIRGLVNDGESMPPPSKRGWRRKSDYTSEQLADRRAEIEARASGQSVRTFVANEWTLEYDLAYHGLAREVWIAAQLARADERMALGRVTTRVVMRRALKAYKAEWTQSRCEIAASHIYKQFDDGASKAVSAQYLAALLKRAVDKGRLSAASLRVALPPYLVDAIEHVTSPAPAPGAVG